jgi:hypothetical protein
MHIGYVNYNVRAAMIISDMEKKGAPKGAFLYLMPICRLVVNVHYYFERK